MNNYIAFFLFLLLAAACGKTADSPAPSLSDKQPVDLQTDVLADKIKGGWAGQTIGCTFGGPTEFRYKGGIIHDYVPIEWHDSIIRWWYDNSPGLYDDIFMDLTFVQVFEKYGLNASVDSFATAFAHAPYPLWHANQAARYNILNGIMPPQSGHWMQNPHSDCIDFQIEADFAGLMSPGMPNTASEICDRIGHIMNYGDGWYGGVYVAAMYSLAFVSDDIQFIVSEALKTIPEESDFYRCMVDVIAWHTQYPDDWKQTWFLVEKNWAEDVGCPHGALDPFNIDAKINAAYILIGLLYGNGDFEKTMDISTRCGQDSDCNPASAAGILGTMIGYEKIPAKWKTALHEVEDRDFSYTDISLNEVYAMSLRQAVSNINNNKGKSSAGTVTILYQEPVPVKFEKGFPELIPVKKLTFSQTDSRIEGVDSLSFTFEGVGFVINGSTFGDAATAPKGHVYDAALYIDGRLAETAELPLDFLRRRHEMFWKYDLAPGKHSVTVKLLHPLPATGWQVTNVIVYDKKMSQNN